MIDPYRIQVYISLIHNLYIALCAHHPKSTHIFECLLCAGTLGIEGRTKVDMDLVPTELRMSEVAISQIFHEFIYI